MKLKNVILAGVGGHGVITLTHLLSQAVVEQGLKIKQTEVLGFAQREGSVYAHIRYSDKDIYSCVIPIGEADIIVGTEPGEALRYVKYLKPEGIIVTNSCSFPEDQTAIYNRERVLQAIRSCPQHVLIDAPEICRQAGCSTKSSNLVILGAVSPYLGLEYASLRKVVSSWLERKESNLEQNLRAFELGKKFTLSYIANE